MTIEDLEEEINKSVEMRNVAGKILTELRKAGVVFESQTAFLDFFATHVSVDEERRFVTGQNQNSGLETAHAMIGILSERD